MNRSSTLETSTSSITLSSTLQMSRSGSNLKKRKLNLSPEVGGVDFVVEDEEESSKEGDNSSQTVNNGGLIKENTKCNQGSDIRRNVVPVKPFGKISPIWNHFKVYPSYYNGVLQKDWSIYAVCIHCYAKYSKDQSVTTSTLWEINIGRTHSTSKLNKHLRRHHMDFFMELRQRDVNFAAAEFDEELTPISSHFKNHNHTDTIMVHVLHT